MSKIKPFVKRDNGFLGMTISNFTQFKITCNIYQLLILNAIKCKLYSKLRYMEKSLANYNMYIHFDWLIVSNINWKDGEP